MIFHRIYRQSVASLLIAVFVLTQAASADLSSALFSGERSGSHANFDLSNIFSEPLTIPQDIGRIEQIHRGRNNNLVVLIQDAHANYSAQKNIVSIIEQFINVYGIRLVGQEGGEGRADMALLRAFPIHAATEEVMDGYLRRGALGGPEYLAITSETAFDFVGVEKEKLYEENLKQFLDVLAVSDRGTRFIRSALTSIQNLQTVAYSEAHQAFNKLVSDYKSNKIDLYAFLGKLFGHARSVHVDINTFPLTAKLKSAMEQQEKELSMEEQKKALTDVVREAEAARLFIEIEELSYAVRSKLAGSETERKLVGLEEFLFLFGRGLRLELSRQDAVRFRRLGNLLTKDKIKDFLNRASEQYRVALTLGVGFQEPADDFAKAIVSFYETAKSRDDVLIDRLRKEMAIQNVQAAVLVAGGFHTEGIIKKLRRLGASYVLVTPKIIEPSSQEDYLHVMERSGRLLRLIENETINAPLIHVNPALRSIFLKEALPEVAARSTEQRFRTDAGVSDSGKLAEVFAKALASNGIISFEDGRVTTPKALMEAARRFDHWSEATGPHTKSDERRALVDAVLNGSTKVSIPKADVLKKSPEDKAATQPAVSTGFGNADTVLNAVVIGAVIGAVASVAAVIRLRARMAAEQHRKLAGALSGREYREISEEKIEAEIYRQFPHLRKLSFWKHPILWTVQQADVLKLAEHIAALEKLFTQGVVDAEESVRLSKIVFETESEMGLRDESRMFQVSVGGILGELDPMLDTIVPYRYLEPSRILPQNFQDAINVIEEKVRAISKTGSLPVIRVIGKPSSGVSTFIESIIDRGTFAGIEAGRMRVVDDKLLWAFGLSRDHLPLDVLSEGGASRSTGLIILDNNWAINRITLDDVPVDFEPIDVYVEASEEERWQRLTEAETDADSWEVDHGQALMNLMHTHQHLANEIRDRYDSDSLKLNADVVVYSDELIEKIASGKIPATPIVPSEERASGFGAEPDDTGEVPSDEEPESISIEDFKKVLAGAVSIEQDGMHTLDVQVWKGTTRWIDDQFAEVNHHLLRAGFYAIQERLYEEFDREPEEMEEVLRAGDILNLEEVNGDTSFVVDLFALGVALAGWKVIGAKNDLKRAKAVGITEEGRARVELRKRLRLKAKQMKRQARYFKDKQIQDFSKEDYDFPEFAKAVAAFEESKRKLIEEFLRPPEIEDFDFEQVKKYLTAQHSKLLEFLWQIGIIPPEGLAVPSVETEFDISSAIYSPLLRFVARIIKPEFEYLPHTPIGRVRQARKKVLELGQASFDHKDARDAFVDWIAAEQEGLIGAFSALSGLGMDVIAPGGIRIAIDLKLNPDISDLEDAILGVLSSAPQERLIESIQIKAGEFGFTVKSFKTEEGEAHNGTPKVPKLFLELDPPFISYEKPAHVSIRPDTPAKVPLERGLAISARIQDRQFDYVDRAIDRGRIAKEGENIVVYRYPEQGKRIEVRKLKVGEFESGPVEGSPFYVTRTDENSVVIQSAIESGIGVRPVFNPKKNMPAWEGFQEAGYERRSIESWGGFSFYHTVRIFKTADGLLVLEQSADEPDLITLKTADDQHIVTQYRDETGFKLDEMPRSFERGQLTKTIRYDAAARKLTIETSNPIIYIAEKIRILPPGRKTKKTVQLEIKPLAWEGFRFMESRERSALKESRVNWDRRVVDSRFETDDGLVSLWRNGLYETNVLVTADGQYVFGKLLFVDGQKYRGPANDRAFHDIRTENPAFEGKIGQTGDFVHSMRYDSHARVLTILSRGLDSSDEMYDTTVSVTKEGVTVPVKIVLKSYWAEGEEGAKREAREVGFGAESKRPSTSSAMDAIKSIPGRTWASFVSLAANLMPNFSERVQRHLAVRKIKSLTSQLERALYRGQRLNLIKELSTFGPNASASIPKIIDALEQTDYMPEEIFPPLSAIGSDAAKNEISERIRSWAQGNKNYSASTLKAFAGALVHFGGFAEIISAFRSPEGVEKGNRWIESVAWISYAYAKLGHRALGAVPMLIENLRDLLEMFELETRHASAESRRIEGLQQEVEGMARDIVKILEEAKAYYGANQPSGSDQDFQTNVMALSLLLSQKTDDFSIYGQGLTLRSMGFMGDFGYAAHELRDLARKVAPLSRDILDLYRKSNANIGVLDDADTWSAHDHIRSYFSRHFPHLDSAVLGKTTMLFGLLAPFDLTIGAQQFLKMWIYDALERGDSSFSIKEKMTQKIVPSVRMLEALDADFPNMGAEIDIIRLKDKEETDETLSKKEDLSNFFMDVLIPHGVKDSTFDKEQGALEVRMLPSAFPVAFLNLLLHLRLGLLNKQSVYSMTIEGALDQEAFFILALSFFTFNQGVARAYDVKIDPSIQFTDAMQFANAYESYIGATVDPRTGQVRKDQTQTLFSDKTFLWIDDLFGNLARKQMAMVADHRAEELTPDFLMARTLYEDLELKAFLALFAFESLKTQGGKAERQKTYDWVKKEIESFLRGLDDQKGQSVFTREEIDILVGKYPVDFYFPRGDVLPFKLSESHVRPILLKLQKHLRSSDADFMAFHRLSVEVVRTLKAAYFKDRPLAKQAFEEASLGPESLHRALPTEGKLIAMLRSDSPFETKEEVIRVLGAIGGTRAVDALKVFAKEHGEFAFPAHEALEKLGARLERETQNTAGFGATNDDERITSEVREARSLIDAGMLDDAERLLGQISEKAAQKVIPEIIFAYGYLVGALSQEKRFEEAIRLKNEMAALVSRLENVFARHQKFANVLMAHRKIGFAATHAASWRFADAIFNGDIPTTISSALAELSESEMNDGFLVMEMRSFILAYNIYINQRRFSNVDHAYTALQHLLDISEPFYRHRKIFEQIPYNITAALNVAFRLTGRASDEDLDRAESAIDEVLKLHKRFASQNIEVKKQAGNIFFQLLVLAKKNREKGRTDETKRTLEKGRLVLAEYRNFIRSENISDFENLQVEFARESAARERMPAVKQPLEEPDAPEEPQIAFDELINLVATASSHSGLDALRKQIDAFPKAQRTILRRLAAQKKTELPASGQGPQSAAHSSDHDRKKVKPGRTVRELVEDVRAGLDATALPKLEKWARSGNQQAQHALAELKKGPDKSKGGGKRSGFGSATTSPEATRSALRNKEFTRTLTADDDADQIMLNLLSEIQRSRLPIRITITPKTPEQRDALLNYGFNEHLVTQHSVRMQIQKLFESGQVLEVKTLDSPRQYRISGLEKSVNGQGDKRIDFYLTLPRKSDFTKVMSGKGAAFLRNPQLPVKGQSESAALASLLSEFTIAELPLQILASSDRETLLRKLIGRMFEKYQRKIVTEEDLLQAALQANRGPVTAQTEESGNASERRARKSSAARSRKGSARSARNSEIPPKLHLPFLEGIFTSISRRTYIVPKVVFEAFVEIFGGFSVRHEDLKEMGPGIFERFLQSVRKKAQDGKDARAVEILQFLSDEKNANGFRTDFATLSQSVDGIMLWPEDDILASPEAILSQMSMAAWAEVFLDLTSAERYVLLWLEHVMATHFPRLSSYLKKKISAVEHIHWLTMVFPFEDMPPEIFVEFDRFFKEVRQETTHPTTRYGQADELIRGIAESEHVDSMAGFIKLLETKKDSSMLVIGMEVLLKKLRPKAIKQFDAIFKRYLQTYAKEIDQRFGRARFLEEIAAYQKQADELMQRWYGSLAASPVSILKRDNGTMVSWTLSFPKFPPVSIDTLYGMASPLSDGELERAIHAMDTIILIQDSAGRKKKIDLKAVDRFASEHRLIVRVGRWKYQILDDKIRVMDKKDNVLATTNDEGLRTFLLFKIQAAFAVILKKTVGPFGGAIDGREPFRMRTDSVQYHVHFAKDGVTIFLGADIRAFIHRDGSVQAMADHVLGPAPEAFRDQVVSHSRAAFTLARSYLSGDRMPIGQLASFDEVLRDRSLLKTQDQGFGNISSALVQARLANLNEYLPEEELAGLQFINAQLIYNFASHIGHQVNPSWSPFDAEDFLHLLLWHVHEHEQAMVEMSEPEDSTLRERTKREHGELRSLIPRIASAVVFDHPHVADQIIPDWEKLQMSYIRRRNGWELHFQGFTSTDLHFFASQLNAGRLVSPSTPEGTSGLAAAVLRQLSEEGYEPFAGKDQRGSAVVFLDGVARGMRHVEISAARKLRKAKIGWAQAELYADWLAGKASGHLLNRKQERVIHEILAERGIDLSQSAVSVVQLKLDAEGELIRVASSTSGEEDVEKNKEVGAVFLRQVANAAMTKREIYAEITRLQSSMDASEIARRRLSEWAFDKLFIIRKSSSPNDRKNADLASESAQENMEARAAYIEGIRSRVDDLKKEIELRKVWNKRSLRSSGFGAFRAPAHQPVVFILSGDDLATRERVWKELLSDRYAETFLPVFNLRTPHVLERIYEAGRVRKALVVVAYDESKLDYVRRQFKKAGEKVNMPFYKNDLEHPLDVEELISRMLLKQEEQYVMYQADNEFTRAERKALAVTIRKMADVFSNPESFLARVKQGQEILSGEEAADIKLNYPLAGPAGFNLSAQQVIIKFLRQGGKVTPQNLEQVIRLFHLIPRIKQLQDQFRSLPGMEGFHVEVDGPSASWFLERNDLDDLFFALGAADAELMNRNFQNWVTELPSTIPADQHTARGVEPVKPSAWSKLVFQNGGGNKPLSGMYDGAKIPSNVKLWALPGGGIIVNTAEADAFEFLFQLKRLLGLEYNLESDDEPGATAGFGTQNAQQEQFILNAAKVEVGKVSTARMESLAEFKTVVFGSKHDLDEFERRLGKYAPDIRAKVLNGVEAAVAGWDVRGEEASEIWNRLAELFQNAAQREQIFVRDNRSALIRLQGGLDAVLLGQKTDYLLNAVGNIRILESMQESQYRFVQLLGAALQAAKLRDHIFAVAA